MLKQLARFNTLRNQMQFGFIFVMLLILSFVGIVTIDAVSDLLENNAEKQIRQTAIQANGRLEARLERVASLITQVATNPYVQELLLEENQGNRATFSERQRLAPTMSSIQVYAQDIHSVELYTQTGKRLFPLDGYNLINKVSKEWIERADRAMGGTVWYGLDPAYPGTILSLKRIHLMNDQFEPSGYLLVRINQNFIQLNTSDDSINMSTLLIDQDQSLIASNNPDITQELIRSMMASEEQTFELNKQKMVLIRQQSAVTGWTLLFLTPISEITEGLSVLRSAVLLSAGIGTLLFIIISFFLSTIITRPIFQLIRTMRSTRFGELKPTPLINSTIEIRELSRTYNQMIENINNLIRLVYEKELLQNRAELKALQAQVNPHFLYNTLEALNWRLIEKDEEELAQFVLSMSQLFRYTITGVNNDEWVNLSEELEQVKRYLHIMKIRFEDRLTWDIQADAELMSVKVPKLIIQPIVENAVVHGIEGRIGHGNVSVLVSGSWELERLTIEVTDDGKGMNRRELEQLERAIRDGESVSSKSTGIGLSNLMQRIRFYYGEAAQDQHFLTITSQEGKGTSVSMMLPIRRDQW